jgi:hypothetical protein
MTCILIHSFAMDYESGVIDMSRGDFFRDGLDIVRGERQEYLDELEELHENGEDVVDEIHEREQVGYAAGQQKREELKSILQDYLDG